MAMAHEEHGQRCSNSSSDDRGLECGGFGRSSKRLKQKRVPQRGLGVAQLERIRLEEQHKKDATLLSATVLSSFPAVSHTNSSTCLQIQQQLPSIVSPAFRPHLSSPSIPLPPPIDLTSPRPAFRSIPPPHIPKINGMHPSPVVPLSLSKSLSVGVVERSWSGIMVPGHGHWPKLWNGDDNLEGENHRMDHQGVEFRPSMKFPIEPHSPILPLPSMLQRSERHEQPVSSSMVNVSTGISSSSSSSSSSVLEFLMEPPSNQNYNGKNYTSMWPEEVKMVGNKRARPFSSDYPPIPVFHRKFPPGYDLSISRTSELASCCVDCPANVESRNLPTRECPANLKALSESNPGSFTNGSGANFLTLAPPSSVSLPRSDPRYHLRSRNSYPHNQDASSQGRADELIQPSRVSAGSDQPHIFSFFPSTGQEDSPKNSSHEGESSEGVDLNLKL
nr:WAS/WASL-interacting protein family member 1-like isoform X1 [Ipomoea batatas]